MKSTPTNQCIRIPTKFVVGLVTLLAASMAVAAGGAFAQTSPPTTTPGHPTQTPPEQKADKPVPTSPVPEAPPGSLSDKLSKQKGVIEPPKGVDPEMHKAPTEQGRMRVIPPPGSPGAPTDAQPK